MTHRHSWDMKTIGPTTFLVCCRDCGQEDRIFTAETMAEARLSEIRAKEADKFNARLGLSRRMRKAKKR